MSRSCCRRRRGCPRTDRHDSDDGRRERADGVVTREALQRLDESRPDVLLADIGMPGADGYALIREVRRREVQTGRRLPAAAITAYAGNQDRERALAAGFDRHVSKPITHATIIEAVRAMCSGADGTS
jgi:CheY-like chemotaxis protein